MDKLNTHKTDPNKDMHDILIASEPGPGGAPNQYIIYWPNRNGKAEVVSINFQDGNPFTQGWNGITNEVLLAIVGHRLEQFAEGPMTSVEDVEAAKLVQGALDQLKSRTMRRRKANVEGQAVPLPKPGDMELTTLEIKGEGQPVSQADLTAKLRKESEVDQKRRTSPGSYEDQEHRIPRERIASDITGNPHPGGH